MNRPDDPIGDRLGIVCGALFLAIVGYSAWDLWPAIFIKAVALVLLISAVACAGYFVFIAVLMVVGEIDLWLKDRRLERRFRNSNHRKAHP